MLYQKNLSSICRYLLLAGLTLFLFSCALETNFEKNSQMADITQAFSENINNDDSKSFTMGNPIKVRSVNHKSGAIGKYFNFNKSEIDRLLGTTRWAARKFYIYNHSTKRTKLAILWRHRNGGSHSAHGRWVNGAASGQWRVGDEFSIIALARIKVLSINHKSGSGGKYFNFDKNSVTRQIGNSNWHAKEFNILNGYTGKMAKAILWGTRNGGSHSGHGRWVNGAAPGQWRVGDTILIFHKY